MKKIFLFAILLAVSFTSTEVFAQQGYQIAQIQEMNRDMGMLNNTGFTGWEKSGTAEVTVYTLYASVETYSNPGGRKSFATDSLGRCKTTVHFDEVNHKIELFELWFTKYDETSKVKYLPGTEYLTINGNKDDGISDVLWMAVGNICLGNYTIIK